MLMAQRIASAVAGQGGRVYYVGGLVRDRLMGRESKDVDIEVHGVAPQQLEAILDALGEKTEMGANFCVYGLRHYELDIAMPRTAQAAESGQLDFSASDDPFVGTKKAALRRDFTINAMMEDALTGELIDHFGGRTDLQRGVIRHVCGETFVQDPLRVLRAAQFAARFGFSVAPETVALCQGVDLRALAGERIFGELEKALLKSPKPSVFFECLRQMRQLEVWFPEVQALIGVVQEEKHHPEGDVWNHTMLVLDQAALLRDRAKEPLAFMLSALCHDFGKAQETADKGHEAAGVLLSGRFLSRVTNAVRLRRYVLNMVQLYAQPHVLFRKRADRAQTNRLFDASVCPQDLILLDRADCLGRALEADDAPQEAFLCARLKDYCDAMARPGVMGADLVAAGFPPGKELGEALRYAHALRLDGVDRERAIGLAIAFLEGKRQPETDL